MVAVPEDDEAPSQTRTFFFDAPGECERTFMFNIILAAIQAQGRITLSVASLGIATLLLMGGTT